MRKRILAIALLLVLTTLPQSILSEGQTLPFALIGEIYDTDGETLLGGAQVTIHNLQTEENISIIAQDGSYMIDKSEFISGIEDGNTLLVEAVLNDRSGDNTTTISFSGVPFQRCDVYTQSDIPGFPRIEHQPVTAVKEGALSKFTASVIDTHTIYGAELRVWKSNWTDPIVSPIGMEQDENSWSAEIDIPSDTNSPYWPGFYYNISATDGRYIVSTPTAYVFVVDTVNPTIFWNASAVGEQQNITISPNIYDNHGIVGASVTYGNENITFDIPTKEWTGNISLKDTVPAVDVRVPGIMVTINVWDNNNTQRNLYNITVNDNTPPSAITSFTAVSEMDNLNITLAWGKPTDNVAVQSYKIERSTDNVIWNWNIDIPPNTLIYTDVETEPNTNHYYRIRARDAMNNWGESAQANATTPDLSPPVIIHTPTKEWDEGSDLTINATITDSDGTITGAYLEYDNGTFSDTLAMTLVGGVWTANITGTQVAPATLTNDTGGIKYRITATDGTNWRETRQYRVWVQDSTPPSAFNISISLEAFGTRSYPFITWEEAEDDIGIVEYRIAVHTTPFVQQSTDPFEALQWGDGYLLDTAAPDAHYYFAISAYDGRNTGPWTYANISTPALDEDTTPPTIVHNAPTSTREKENLVLDTIISDNKGVKNANITYWHETAEDGGSMSLSYSGANHWKAILPFSTVVGKNINYYIQAADHAGNTAVSGNTSIPYTVNILSRDVALTATPWPCRVRSPSARLGSGP